MTDKVEKKAGSRRNGLVAAIGLGMVFGMVGMSFASVPLYRIFCQVTGYGGTTQRADAPTGVVLNRNITVRFDSNTNVGVPWSFKPDQRSVTMPIGESRQISYHAKNLSDRTVTATATFNITPLRAGAYFNKIQCFCFTKQTLGPGEEAEMPVVFFVDPDIVKDKDLKDFDTLTLSYTFFPVDDPKPVAQSETGGDVTQTIQ